MNRNQINLLNAMKSVDQFFTENPKLLEEKPSLKAAVAQNKVLISGMEALSKAQKTTAKSDVALKGETRTTLVKANLKVLAGVKAVGIATNDTRLKMAADITKSELNKMRDNNLIEESQTTYELGLSLAPKLVEWDVLTPDIEAVNTNSATYDAMDPAIKNIKARSSQATDDLKDKSKESSAFLRDTLDEMMVTIKTSQPVLYAQYQKARAIINIHGEHGKGATPDDSTTKK